MTRIRPVVLLIVTACLLGTGIAVAHAAAADAGTAGAPRISAPPVGAQTCATCHPKAYAIWKKGPHASALSRLTPTEQKEPRCLTCHAPEKAAGFDGVGCEACHGNGRYYFPEYVMRDPELRGLVGLKTPDAATCTRCHDASSPSLVPFDYAKDVARIRHWPAKTTPAAGDGN